MGQEESGRNEELEELSAALDRFCQQLEPERSPEEKAVQLIELRRIGDRLELEFSRRAAAFAKTDTYEQWGSVSPVDWIRHNCQMSRAHAADRVCVGEHLPQLSQSAQAVRSGTIGFAHPFLIARTADALAQSATGRAFDEAPLLEQARQHSVGRFWHKCQHLRHAVDPEGVAREQKDAVEARSLRLSTCEDGMVLLDGELDAIGAATLRTALEPLARPSGSDDTRPPHRRMADALVELATHALDAGELPDQASQRPHLQVTIPLETLLGLKGAPAAEMEFCSPVSFKTGARLACDPTVSRIVLGSGPL